MKGPELKIEFCAYYNDKKEKFDEGGLYPFLEYCQQSKPKDVMVRIDYDSPFEEIDVYCESLGISKLSYEKTDGHGSNFIARFTCDSKSGKPIMKVIYGLGKAGNGGHSYGFSVGDKKFYFDGDGADRIMKINGVKFRSIKNTYDLGEVWNDTTKKNNEENNNEDMSKNVVKINESQLKQVIAESVKRVLMEGLPSLPGYDRWKTSIPDSWDKPDMMDESDFYDMIRSADKEQGQEFVEWLKEYPDLYDSVIGTLESGEEENPFMVAINNGMDWKEICHEFFDIKPVKYYPGDINEGKKKAKLTESKLKEVIKESVQNVMNEISSDMIGRARDKFIQKYGNPHMYKDGVAEPLLKDPTLKTDKYGHPLHPKDNRPLYKHLTDFENAYGEATREEKGPIFRKAQELYKDVYWEDQEIDDVDGGYATGTVYGSVEDENGGVWEFVGAAGFNWEGDWELDDVSDVEFTAPDGTTGSL